MHYYLFSFNRGLFLENCISSIFAMDQDASLTILDDSSYDTFTLDVLSKYSSICTIISSGALSGSARYGGLHANMQLALEDAIQRDIEFPCFIQDDMQLVRPVTQEDEHIVDQFFAANPDSYLLSLSFIRNLSAADFWNKHYIDNTGYAYLRKSSHMYGRANFSDTGCFAARRFVRMITSFEIGEAANSDKSTSRGLVIGRSVFPFMCWLPYPPSFNHRKRSLIWRAIELLGGSGYHNINYLSDGQCKSFMMRSPSDLPVMERYLSANGIRSGVNWSTGGGLYNVKARGGFRKLLVSALEFCLRLRNSFLRFVYK